MKINFDKLTGRGVKIGLVDSGIDLSHPKIGNIHSGVSISIEHNALIRKEENCIGIDKIGHGTACAGIIHNKAPDAAIFNIKIFHDDLTCRGQILIDALQWAIERRLHIVNLSLGTTDITLREPLQEICDKALKENIIIVAASHNEALHSFPAELPNVIGVSGGKIRGRLSYYYQPNSPIDCIARGDAQRLCWLDGRDVMLGSTSYAAPHISGIVCLIKEGYPDATLDAVQRHLKENSLKVKPEKLSDSDVSLKFPIPLNPIRTKETKVKLPWIRRAILYPYNKEMHGLVRFHDCLGFEIVGIIDPIGKGLAGKDAGKAIGHSPLGIRINPNLEDSLDKADTLILGYVDQLSRIVERDLLAESIEAALEHGLNVYSFEKVSSAKYPHLYAKAGRNGVRLVFPDITQAEIAAALKDEASLSPVDVPVVGIFGTSSQQGKFTLQLALRKQLLNRGYRVGQLGTEHQSELFEMDCTFPMGYASPLELPLQYYEPYLDAKMKKICHDNQPDIIIVGGQAGTIPFEISEPNSHHFPTLAFLLGTKPDACILVINSLDPDQYIRDTIDSLRIIGQAPTILLAMSDKEKAVGKYFGRSWISHREIPQRELKKRLLNIESKFGIPAVSIASPTDQDKMVEIVIDHFDSTHGGTDLG